MPLTVNQEDAGSNPVVHPKFNAALAQLAEATDSNPVQFRFESGERYQTCACSSVGLERSPDKREVAGSNPASRTNFIAPLF